MSENAYARWCSSCGAEYPNADNYVHTCLTSAFVGPVLSGVEKTAAVDMVETIADLKRQLVEARDGTSLGDALLALRDAEADLEAALKQCTLATDYGITLLHERDAARKRYQDLWDASGITAQQASAARADAVRARALAADLAGELRHSCEYCEEGERYEVDVDDPSDAWHPISDSMCRLNQGERDALVRFDQGKGMACLTCARLRDQVRVLTEALDGLLARFAVQCEEGWRCTECGVVLSGWHCAEGCEVGQARAAAKEETMISEGTGN